jgi:uncharacterized protein YcfJ
MKSRAFVCVRNAAVAAGLGSVLGLALPALAADSGLMRPMAGLTGLKVSSALTGAPAQRPVYGARLPVGAPAYVRPFRGFLLPRVWVTPTYYITNWQSYGLPRPAQGFGWSRYYDDAVLTDRNGRVYDSVQGVNWQAAQAGQAVVTQTYSPDYDPYNYDGDLLLGNDDVVHGTHWARTADQGAPIIEYDDDFVSAPPAPVARYDRDYDPAFLEACRRDSGLGGAAIGAAAGGLAGNRIAGRGNRTGGTLIGAGVGAVAGMVIDKAEDRERCRRLLARDAQGGYGTAYGTSYGTSYAPPPVGAPPMAPPPPAYAGDYDPAFLEACRRDSGLGGAAIGAAAGGLAGNRIAGRGNRTGGTLIGAGVGAVAGMVIDKAEDRERCRRLLAQYGTGYPPQAGQHGSYPPPPQGIPAGYPPPPPGYYYYYPPPIVTTVTITPGN